ncbi:MAG: hypothetical protein NUV98_06510 [Candidatus Roizmanbacteria bacterium]|nr:hypothetical protein [Candidatus Roizmanbacteria bacterium]
MDNQPTELLPASPQKKKGLIFALLFGFLLTIGVVLFLVSNRSVSNTTNTAPVNPTQSVVDTMEKVEEKLVSGMPDIPMYPDATVEESFKRTVGEMNEYYAVWTVNASVGEIISFYETELAKDGWTITEIPEERNETGDESIAATKNNMNLLINLERVTASDPTEITTDIFVQ